MVFALLAVVLFSISATTATRAARILGGTEANFWRLCVATTVLAIYAYLFGVGLGGPAFSWFVLSGFLGFGLGDLALFQALPRLGSRVSIMLVHCIAAPFAGILEWLWLGTAITPLEILSAVILMTGVCLGLAGDRDTGNRTPRYISGILFGTLAAVGQASGAVLSRKAFLMDQTANFSIDGISAAYQRILGGVFISGVWLLCTLPTRGKSQLTRSFESLAEKTRHVGPWVIVNGLAGPAFGVSCYQWALKTTPTAIVLPIVALTPLAVIPIVRFTEGDRPTKRSVVGAVIAVLGVILLALGRTPPGSAAR